MSPMQRTLKELKNRGLMYEIVEHWNSWSKTRKDLFGFADVITFWANCVVLIQVTTMSNRSSHMKKIQDHKIAKAWLEHYPHRMIELWCWRKLKEGWKPNVTRFYPNGTLRVENE